MKEITLKIAKKSWKGQQLPTWLKKLSMSPCIDLIMLNTFTQCQNFAKPNNLKIYMQKTTVWPVSSIFSHSGHVFQQVKNPHISSMQNTPRIIQTKFGSNWSSSVRGEEFWKIVNNDNGCQVMAMAHMAWKSRKSYLSRKKIISV